MQRYAYARNSQQQTRYDVRHFLIIFSIDIFADAGSSAVYAAELRAPRYCKERCHAMPLAFRLFSMPRHTQPFASAASIFRRADERDAAALRHTLRQDIIARAAEVRCMTFSIIFDYFIFDYAATSHAEDAPYDERIIFQVPSRLR